MFTNDQEAAVFVAGMERASLGNNLVYDRNTGDTDANRTVIVGCMDEEVAFDAEFSERVKLRGVAREKADNHAITRHLEQRAEADRVQFLKDSKELGIILDAIGEDKDFVARSGNGWAQVGRGRDEAYTITWKSVDGPFTLEADAMEFSQGVHDISGPIRGMAEQYGCRIDEGWMLSPKDPIHDQQALRGALAVISGLLKDFDEERSRIYHEKFVAKTKMTAMWARMIVGSVDSGMIITVNRRMERAHFGGEDIGRTDISTLVDVGWVTREGDRLHPTEAGIAAAEKKLGKTRTPTNK
jgi:hypothetical protein